MAEFESWRQFWEFSDYVMKKARHVLDAKNRQFIEAIIETSEKRKVTIPVGTVLWRAQLGNITRTEAVTTDDGGDPEFVDIECPYEPERMKPLADRASEGRVNPKGIPCLYCSTDRETAMTETRPWVGSYVTVAEFELRNPLTVVDCSMDLAGVLYPVFGEPKPPQREKYVWNSINRAFSRPVTRTDDVAEYAPTQVLAEAFRSAGFGGIKYGSKLGEGMNVAIFDLGAAKPTFCHLYKVKNVKLEYAPVQDW